MAIGVAALIIVMALMNGFTTTLRERILSASSHGFVTPLGKRSVPYDASVSTFIQDTPYINSVTPFVYSELILSTENGVKGVILRGIEPITAGETITILSELKQGSVKDLEHNNVTDDTHGIPGIIIGEELANALGLTIGSDVTLLSSSGRRSTIGFTPKQMLFRVVGIFSTGMFEYDSSLVFVNIVAARTVLGIRNDAVSGYEFSLTDLDKAPEAAKVLREELWKEYRVRTWQEMNVNLFAALELEKKAMFIFLSLIVLVGAFSIATTLIMMIMEKRRDIAVLMSLGATPAFVRAIFLWHGMIIATIGVAAGVILGVSLSLLLRKYQFISLPEGVYPFSTLPVIFSPTDIVLTIVATFALCFCATLYPAHKAAKIQPARALRYE